MLSLANCIGVEASNRYDSSALNPIVTIVSLYRAFPQKFVSILDTCKKYLFVFRHPSFLTCLEKVWSKFTFGDMGQDVCNFLLIAYGLKHQIVTILQP